MPTSDLPDVIFGCGYLGLRVAEQWRQQGRSVIAVTRSAQRANDFRRQGLIPFVADVCQPDTLSALPEADRVLWAVGFDRSHHQTQTQVFVDGLGSVLERMKTRCRRFVGISSTSVYGQNDGSWVDESSPCEPVQPGGVNCLAAEWLLRAAFPESGRGVSLRLAGIYGPGRVLAKIEALRACCPLPGVPEAWLNLIHVEDAVSAVSAVFRIDDPPEKVLIVDDQPVRRGEYYARLARLVSAPPPQFDDTLPRPRGAGGLNKRCRNVLMHSVLPLRLRYPDCETGLPAAVGELPPGA